MNGVALKPHSHRSALLFAFAYLVAAIGALLLTKGSSGIAAIWPPSGIMLAGVLLLRGDARTTLYLGAFIASMVANAIIGTSLWASIAFSVANIAEAATARALILNFKQSSRDIASARNIITTGAAACVAAVLSALIASVLTSEFESGFLISWASTVFFGMITITPAILFIAIDIKEHERSLVSIVSTTSLIVLSGAVAFWQTDVPLLWLPIAAAGFATYRLGLTGAAVSLLALAITGAVHSSAGLGVSGLDNSVVGTTLFLQIYLAGVLLALLPLAALLSKYQSIMADLVFARQSADLQATEARRLAETDALTGVANRGKIIECLRAEIAHAKATGRDLSILMMDVDHFKSVNDRFGHAKGDLALMAVANEGRALAGRSGHFGRIGGEEFLLVLPGIGIDQAAEIADEMRFGVHHLDWVGHAMDPITLSIGVAQHAGMQDDASLLGEADGRLYAAKRAGRNQICISDPPLIPLRRLS